MTSTAPATTDSPSGAAAILAAVKSKTAEIHRAEVEKIELTIAWAVIHEIDPADADPAGFGDRALPLAGVGAPLLSEFAAMEYAAAVGMSTDAG